MNACAVADPAGVVVAVVVTMNRRAQLKRTIERLLSQSINHVIVVDNGSTDGTRRWLSSQDEPRLTVELSDRNLGGAGGFARGITLARERFDPDWIIVMDDDARPHPGAIERFRQTDLEQWDAIVSAVFHPGGRICEMNRPSYNPFWKPSAFVQTILGGGRKGFHVTDEAFASDRILPVDVSSFVGLFLSRKAIDAAGLPDERLFIYGDDVLYSLALRRSGGRIGFAADIAFEHDCAERAASKGRGVAPLWKVYYLVRNKIVVYRRVAGPLFWVMFPALLAKWRYRTKIYGENGDAYRQLVRAAVSDGLAGRFCRDHAEVLELAES